MRKRILLSKESIQQIVKQHKQTIPEIEQLGVMAEEHRRQVRNRRRPRQLKSTDYLSAEQFTEVISFVKSEADVARGKSPGS